MKNYIKLFCLAFFCLLTITSCKKEIDYHPEWDPSFMSGKIDGVLLECPLLAAQTNVIGEKTTLQIVGQHNNKAFTLTINDFKGVGTYPVSSPNEAIYIANSPKLQNTFTAIDEGNIKITSYTDQKIKGTFEFQGYNQDGNIITSVNITNGTFFMPYSKQ